VSVSAVQPQTPVAPQIWPVPLQVPQVATARDVPQLSVALVDPQFLDRREQSSASVSGLQQTFGVGDGGWAQTCAAVQAAVPQSTAVPQLSVMMPHLPAQVAAIGARAQPHTLAVTAPHCCPGPAPHWVVPQVTVPVPQPFGIVPQLVPDGQGMTGEHPQWPGVPPPPHVCGAAQVPQVTMPPHPSGAVSQFCPGGQACAGVSGVHPHTLATLGDPPAQVFGAMQLPQS